ncbi:MAG: hypothetical protein ACD_37C00069G0003 [uncultured bacterium]|nr:MAG: hypothetical protein ACD_37C00069G0003 [uncultured bacterium]
MIVPYSPLPDIKSKIVLAPLVPITFYNGKYEFSTLALIDSGASGAVISTVIAEALGIGWSKIPVEGGFSVGGSFRFHLIKDIKASVYDNDFTLNLSVIEGVSPYKCILGQADIFKKAKISFEGYKNQFEIIFKEFN